jgi:hypothetical protein
MDSGRESCVDPTTSRVEGPFRDGNPHPPAFLELLELLLLLLLLFVLVVDSSETALIDRTRLGELPEIDDDHTIP